MKRRGIVFTLMAIIIVAFLITSGTIVPDAISPTSSDTAAAQTRVTTINAYLDTFEDYAGESLAITGYAALENMSRKVGVESAFIPNLNATVNNCIVNNNISVAGIGYNCTLNQSAMTTLLDEMVEVAESNLSIHTRYQLRNAWITEEHPMEVVFWLNLTYSIEDPFASWDVQNVTIRAPVDVSGVSDPVYRYMVAKGYASAQRSFTLSPYKQFQFNTTHFDELYVNGSYLQLEGRAPSVLQRYMGNLTNTSSCCGIESVVRRTEVLGGSAVFANYSFADHHYAAHRRGDLPQFDCTINNVKGYSVTGGTLPLEASLFDSVYNLTGAQPQCQWP